MAHLLPRRASYVCKACSSSQTSRNVARTLATRTLATTAHRARSLREQLEERGSSPKTSKLKISKSTTPPRRPEGGPTIPKRQDPQPQTTRPTEHAQSKVKKDHAEEPQVPAQPSIAQLKEELQTIRIQTLKLLDMVTTPEEEAAREVVERARYLAEALQQKDISDDQYSLRQSEQWDADADASQLAASSALSLQERSRIRLSLAKAIYTLMEDPKLYISEKLLSIYVHTIITLSAPQYLPKIFHLYAHKPIPVPNTSSPIKYTQPWSRHPKYGIPPSLADLAIESAIKARDMPLAITLIDTTVATPQFHIAKFIRRASIPLTLSGSVIPLSWMLSTRAAEWQLSWDPNTFFWMCMAGAGAYIGTMGTLLLITVTTWNDHHKRVRWVPGTPMGRRWFREEERYYFDRIAESWGYKDANRHGEERGEEWEALREVCGLRWMEVDRSSLLPGML